MRGKEISLFGIIIGLQYALALRGVMQSVSAIHNSARYLRGESYSIWWVFLGLTVQRLFVCLWLSSPRWRLCARLYNIRRLCVVGDFAMCMDSWLVICSFFWMIGEGASRWYAIDAGWQRTAALSHSLTSLASAWRQLPPRLCTTSLPLLQDFARSLLLYAAYSSQNPKAQRKLLRG